MSDCNTLKYLAVCKQINSGLFENNITYNLFIYKSYLFNIYMYKQDLGFNNLQEFICDKTQPNITPQEAS